MINPFYIIKDRNGWAFGYSSVNDEIRLDYVGRELFATINPPNPDKLRFTWIVEFNDGNGREMEYKSFDEIHDDLYSMMEAHGALPRQAVYARPSGAFHAEDVSDPREQWADIGQAVKENFLVEADGE